MNVRAVSRRFGAVALVIGPLGLVLGSLFQVVSDDDSVSASLAKIAAHPFGERAEIICDAERVSVSSDGLQTIVTGSFGEREIAPYGTRIAPTKRTVRKALHD